MTVFKSIQFLIIAAALISGIFSSPIKAQINAPFTSANNQTNFYSSDQPFASYWFPLEILSWSPSTDPDAPYNRSGVLLINKFI